MNSCLVTIQNLKKTYLGAIYDTYLKLQWSAPHNHVTVRQHAATELHLQPFATSHDHVMCFTMVLLKNGIYFQFLAKLRP